MFRGFTQLHSIFYYVWICKLASFYLLFLFLISYAAVFNLSGTGSLLLSRATSNTTKFPLESDISWFGL